MAEHPFEASASERERRAFIAAGWEPSTRDAIPAGYDIKVSEPQGTIWTHASIRTPDGSGVEWFLIKSDARPPAGVWADYARYIVDDDGTWKYLSGPTTEEEAAEGIDELRVQAYRDTQTPEAQEQQRQNLASRKEKVPEKIRGLDISVLAHEKLKTEEDQRKNAESVYRELCNLCEVSPRMEDFERQYAEDNSIQIERHYRLRDADGRAMDGARVRFNIVEDKKEGDVVRYPRLTEGAFHYGQAYYHLIGLLLDKGLVVDYAF